MEAYEMDNFLNLLQEWSNKPLESWKKMEIPRIVEIGQQNVGKSSLLTSICETNVFKKEEEPTRPCPTMQELKQQERNRSGRKKWNFRNQSKKSQRLFKLPVTKKYARYNQP